jgi:hypothetical protein
MTYLRANWLWIVIPFALGAAAVMAGAWLLESDTVQSFQYGM